MYYAGKGSRELPKWLLGNKPITIFVTIGSINREESSNAGEDKDMPLADQVETGANNMKIGYLLSQRIIL